MGDRVITWFDIVNDKYIIRNREYEHTLETAKDVVIHDEWLAIAEHEEGGLYFNPIKSTDSGFALISSEDDANRYGIKELIVHIWNASSK